MAIQRINPASSVSVEPIGSAGTYVLSTPLQPGLYRVTTDTTQSLSASQLYVQTSQGFRFGSVVRGGQGYLSVPQTTASLTFTTGTFPLLVGFERFLSYNLISAPTSVSFTYTSPLTPFTASISYAVPSGAASMGVYWPNGTFPGLPASATTASVTLPTTPTFGVVYPALVVAMDSKGVWGLGAPNVDPFDFAVFTSSGSFTTIPGRNSVNLLLVGGGAGGGESSGANAFRNGGGGGAGAVRQLNAQTVSGSVAVTIGAAGNATLSPNAGGTTFFGSASAAGGGAGSSHTQAAQPGGASGGGGGANNTTAGNGTSPWGFAGGAGAPGGDTRGGGSGGSVNGVGGAAAGATGGTSPTGTTLFGFESGRGGGGGGSVGGNFGGNNMGTGGSTYGGGGTGGGCASAGAPGNVNIIAATAGNAGIVVVEVI